MFSDQCALPAALQLSHVGGHFLTVNYTESSRFSSVYPFIFDNGFEANAERARAYKA